MAGVSPDTSSLDNLNKLRDLLFDQFRVGTKLSESLIASDPDGTRPIDGMLLKRMLDTFKAGDDDETYTKQAYYMGIVAGDAASPAAPGAAAGSAAGIDKGTVVRYLYGMAEFMVESKVTFSFNATLHVARRLAPPIHTYITYMMFFKFHSKNSLILLLALHLSNNGFSYTYVRDLYTLMKISKDNLRYLIKKQPEATNIEFEPEYLDKYLDVLSSLADFCKVHNYNTEDKTARYKFEYLTTFVDGLYPDIKDSAASIPLYTPIGQKSASLADDYMGNEESIFGFVRNVFPERVDLLQVSPAVLHEIEKRKARYENEKGSEEKYIKRLVAETTSLYSSVREEGDATGLKAVQNTLNATLEASEVPIKFTKFGEGTFGGALREYRSLVEAILFERASTPTAAASSGSSVAIDTSRLERQIATANHLAEASKIESAGALAEAKKAVAAAGDGTREFQYSLTRLQENIKAANDKAIQAEAAASVIRGESAAALAATGAATRGIAILNPRIQSAEHTARASKQESAAAKAAAAVAAAAADQAAAAAQAATEASRQFGDFIRSFHGVNPETLKGVAEHVDEIGKRMDSLSTQLRQSGNTQAAAAAASASAAAGTAVAKANARIEQLEARMTQVKAELEARANASDAKLQHALAKLQQANDTLLQVQRQAKLNPALLEELNKAKQNANEAAVDARKAQSELQGIVKELQTMFNADRLDTSGEASGSGQGGGGRKSRRGGAEKSAFELAKEFAAKLDVAKKNLRAFFDFLDGVQSKYDKTFREILRKHTQQQQPELQTSTDPKTLSPDEQKIQGEYQLLENEGKKWIEGVKKDFADKKAVLVSIQTTLTEIYSSDPNDKKYVDKNKQVKEYFEGFFGDLNADDYSLWKEKMQVYFGGEPSDAPAGTGTTASSTAATVSAKDGELEWKVWQNIIKRGILSSFDTIFGGITTKFDAAYNRVKALNSGIEKRIEAAKRDSSRSTSDFGYGDRYRMEQEQRAKDKLRKEIENLGKLVQFIENPRTLGTGLQVGNFLASTSVSPILSKLDQQSEVIQKLKNVIDNSAGSEGAFADDTQITLRRDLVVAIEEFIDRNNLLLDPNYKPKRALQQPTTSSASAPVPGANTQDDTDTLINSLRKSLAAHLQKVHVVALDDDYSKKSNLAFASATSEPALYEKIYNKYVADKSTIGQYVAAEKLSESLKANDLVPREVLKVTAIDKVIFVFLTLFLRIFTLSIVEMLIERGWIKTIHVAMFAFLIVYTILFAAFVLYVNLDQYQMRMTFNYVNFHANGGLVFTHIGLLYLFSVIVYLLLWALNVPGLSLRNNITATEKSMITYRMEVITMVTWIFLLILIVIF